MNPSQTKKMNEDPKLDAANASLADPWEAATDVMPRSRRCWPSPRSLVTHVTCFRDTLHRERKRASGNSRNAHCGACVKLGIDAATAYLRVGIEPARTGASAAFGLRAVLLEARGMRDATDAIPLRSNEHGRVWHETRRSTGHVLLLCRKGATLGIAMPSVRSFSGGTYRGSRPNGRRPPHPALAACPPRSGSLAASASIPSLHIPNLRLS